MWRSMNMHNIHSRLLHVNYDYKHFPLRMQYISCFNRALMEDNNSLQKERRLNNYTHRSIITIPMNEIYGKVRRSEMCTYSRKIFTI